MVQNAEKWGRIRQSRLFYAHAAMIRAERMHTALQSRPLVLSLASEPVCADSACFEAFMAVFLQGKRHKPWFEARFYGFAAVLFKVKSLLWPIIKRCILLHFVLHAEFICWAVEAVCKS